MKQAPKKPESKTKELAFTKENALKTPKSLLKKIGLKGDTELALSIVKRRFPNAWNRADNMGKRTMIRRYRNWIDGAVKRDIRMGLEG